VNDLTRDSDRILSESKALVRDNREGGRHRCAPSIGQGSAKAKRDHLLKKVRNVVIAVFAIWLALWVTTWAPPSPRSWLTTNGALITS